MSNYTPLTSIIHISINALELCLKTLPTNFFFKHEFKIDNNNNNLPIYILSSLDIY